MHVHGWIDTPEGGHIVCPGDYIITGVQGEYYPCKPDIFAQTYEKLENSEEACPKKGCFAVQVIARGSFTDSATGSDKMYIIETIVLRLNYLALIGYNESLCHECRECYADGEEGEQEWQEYKARQTEKRKAWEDSIKDSLGIRNSAGSFHITQSELEVFTVVHVREAGKGKGNASGEGN